MTNKYRYREYLIVRTPLSPAADPSYLIYDDEHNFLDTAFTMIEAQDWIEAEQAGEHDN
jgi:hypothetical protein